jgi:outer-membrane receptor for ferric coprogen and ferric-rhodotorulic acid
MRRRVSGGGLLCVFAIVLVWSCCAQGKATEGKDPAAGEPQTYLLKITSQPLSDALQEFSRQSGIQVVFFSHLTDGLRAPTLEGKYTLSQALHALLANSKLTFRSINANTVQIEPVPQAPAEDTRGAAPPAAPQLIKNGGVRGSPETASSPDSDEIIVTGTAEGLVATRVETPLRDIPQTISIISREQMRQQNDADLADALQNAVGITAVRSDSLDEEFFSRGYQITSFHVDGGAAMTATINSTVLFLGTPDMNEYDHIEVLRGADSLFAGVGNPGGTVNLVRKRPLATEEVMFSSSTGSWSNEREELDLTGPLGFDGALRGRLDGLYQDRNYFYEIASLKRRKLFGALEIDVTPATLLTLGGSYESDDSMPVGTGLPFYFNGSDSHLPRSTALGFDWAFDRSRMRELYLQLQHEFAPGWKIKTSASLWNWSQDYGIGTFGEPIDPRTDDITAPPNASFSNRPNTLKQQAFDVTLVGTFDWFGRRVEAALGGDFARLTDLTSGGIFTNFGPKLTNPFAYNPAEYPDPLSDGPILEVQGTGTSQQTGGFASMRIYLNDVLSIVAGARINSNRAILGADLSSPLVAGTYHSSTELGNSAVVTPYAGMTYHLDSRYSLYMSYADVYSTLGTAQAPDGKLLGVTRGTDLEVGTKGAWRDGAVNGSLVLYKAVQQNVPVLDTTLTQPLGSSLYCCYLAGSNRSHGVDVELSGQLAPDWLIAAGYTLNINQAAAGGELSSVTPRHLLKLWTSKGLPGRLNRWTVGGTLHAQSSVWQELPCNAGIYASCPAGPQPVVAVQGPYAVLDLRMSYQLHAHWQAALTVGNVFDRVYYQTLSLANNWYGEPRALTLRIDATY